MTLVYVIDSCLRLLHPYMPFVTEAVWQRLPHDSTKEPALMVSGWPQDSSYVDSVAIERFGRLQSLVRSIRNARAEYQVEPGRRIVAVVTSTDESMSDYFREEEAVLCSLARLDPEGLRIGTRSSIDVPQGDSAVHLIVADGLDAYLPMAGMIDFQKEKERLEKQLARAEKDLEGLTRRLESSGFAKAPPKVIQETKDGAVQLKEKVDSLRKRLEDVAEMATAGS